MKWYKGWYGSWANGGCVHHLDGTYNRKEMFSKAQEVADQTGEVVTVCSEVGGASGLRVQLYEVKPFG